MIWGLAALVLVHTGVLTFVEAYLVIGAIFTGMVIMSISHRKGAK